MRRLAILAFLFGLWALAPGAAGAAILWRGDFETGDFTQWGSVSGNSVTTGALLVVDSPVRDGTYAMRVEVDGLDCPLADDKNADGSCKRNRAEVSKGTGEREGTETWWAWSIYFPDEFNPNPGAGLTGGYNIVTQWHATTPDGSPNIAFQVWTTTETPELKLKVLGGDKSSPTIRRFSLGQLERNVWIDFVFHVRWSATGSGFVELWRDGALVVPLTATPTLHPSLGVYVKQGYYRSLSTLTSVFFIDALRRGETCFDVGCPSPVAPSNATPPAVSGTPQEGEALQAQTGSWTGTEPVAFAYQWRRCDDAGTSCTDIDGAEAKTYTAATGDVDSTLRIEVTASNGAGSDTATSSPTAVVEPAPPPSPAPPPPLSGAWTAKASLPASLLDAGGTALGGKLYVVAGKTSSGRRKTVYAYDPLTNKWASKASLPSAYPAVENPAVAALNGKLYVFGGQTSSTSGAKTSAAVYDPATNVWKMLAPMPVARGAAQAQAVEGRIYVVGGLDGLGGSLATTSVYEPDTNRWIAGPSMGTRRDHFASAVLGGKLYVFGGRTRNANGTTVSGALASVEALDPATNTWATKAGMPTARRGAVVGTLDGKAQVIGGQAGGSTAAVLGHNEEFDPETESWRAVTAMLTPRQGAVAGTVGGAVYVAGGGKTGGTSYSSKNEAFAF